MLQLGVEMKEKNGRIIYDKKSIILFLLSLVMGGVSVWLSPSLIVVSLLPMSISAGLMASYLYKEKENDGIYKFLLPAILIIADWLINGLSSLISIIIVVVAVFVFCAYDKKISKSEVAMTIALIVAFAIGLTYVIIGSQNELGLSVKDFYMMQYEKMKEFYVASINQMYESLYEDYSVEKLTTEEIIYTIDYSIGLLFSMLFTLGFFATGVSMKTFVKVIERTEKEEIEKWKFTTSPVYAYFYAIISLVSFFLGEKLSAFNLVVLNLSMIFMMIYAYVGWNASSKLASMRNKSSSFFKVIIIISIVCLPGFAIRVLSYVGAFYTVAMSKINNLSNSSGKPE